MTPPGRGALEEGPRGQIRLYPCTFQWIGQGSGRAKCYLDPCAPGSRTAEIRILSLVTHRILSLAPDARFPTWCELMEPVLDPRLRRETARRRRLRKYRMGIFLAERLVPGLRRIHEIVADGPEECTHLHEHAFDSESMALLGPCTVGFNSCCGSRLLALRARRSLHWDFWWACVSVSFSDAESNLRS